MDRPNRGWRQRAWRLGLALLVTAAVAGCGGAAATPSARSSAAPDHGRRLVQAGCNAAAAVAPPLPSVRTAMVHMDGEPFGIAVTADGRWAFVGETRGALAVFSDTAFAPRLVRTIAMPRRALGDALTDDGRYLLVADGDDGATVVSVAGAQTDASHAVLGTLQAPGQPAQPGHIGGGAIEVTSSPNGDYVFVSVEYSDEVAVYDLKLALADDFHTSGYIGSVPLGGAVVGMAGSPDGRWLYATSEVAAGAHTAAGEGTLSVISLAKAESDPARAVVATVAADCQPVRVAVSADGATVWVTARASNKLLAFSAAKLRSDPSHALLASASVGIAPVGLAMVDGGRRVVVGDSNRYVGATSPSTLTIVNTPAALAHRPADLGTIPAGSFPREMALEPNGRTLLVGNRDSGQLEAVYVAMLP
jgi:DNA-binding beta-propeller fold protein YncE